MLLGDVYLKALLFDIIMEAAVAYLLFRIVQAIWRNSRRKSQAARRRACWRR